MYTVGCVKHGGSSLTYNIKSFVNYYGTQRSLTVGSKTLGSYNEFSVYGFKLVFMQTFQIIS